MQNSRAMSTPAASVVGPNQHTRAGYSGSSRDRGQSSDCAGEVWHTMCMAYLARLRPYGAIFFSPHIETSRPARPR